MMIETMRFRLSSGADESAFAEVDKRVQTVFAYQQPGLIRRTAAHGDDGSWIVIDLWRSKEDADSCAEIWGDDPVTAAFMAFVDESTVQIERYQSLE